MKEFLKIGEVAKQFKITTRTLRFYEENGLFLPEKIDENKYRLYSTEQLGELRKILFLKELGLDLHLIKEYLTSGKNTQKQILENFNKKCQLYAEMSEDLLKSGNFELKNIEDVVYFGNQVRKKSLKALCGVWVLDGVYKNLKDAQNHKDALNVFSPYKFLAFDEEGNSPWFYNADSQKIYFNTFFKPISEVYQIKDNQLFVRIANPKQHIFVEADNAIDMPHILVFKLFSKNFEDYKKFVVLDDFNEKQIVDKKLVGCWKLCGKTTSILGKNVAPTNGQALLLVEKNFTATMYGDKSIRHLIWTKNFIYDNNAHQKMQYKISGHRLTLQNKTTSYTFTGQPSANHLVFERVD